MNLHLVQAHRRAQTLVLKGYGPIKPISSGFRHTCGVMADASAPSWGKIAPLAVDTDGSAACRGVDQHGETSPQRSVFPISVGSFHSRGIKADGTVNCWGDDHVSESIPTEREFAAIYSGYGTCGTETNGSAICWGGQPMVLPALPRQSG